VTSWPARSSALARKLRIESSSSANSIFAIKGAS
jgi:hypothetical protein